MVTFKCRRPKITTENKFIYVPQKYTDRGKKTCKNIIKNYLYSKINRVVLWMKVYIIIYVPTFSYPHQLFKKKLLLIKYLKISNPKKMTIS